MYTNAEIGRHFYKHITLWRLSLSNIKRFLMKECWQSELDLQYLVFRQHTKSHVNTEPCEKKRFVAQILLANLLYNFYQLKQPKMM